MTGNRPAVFRSIAVSATLVMPNVNIPFTFFAILNIVAEKKHIMGRGAMRRAMIKMPVCGLLLLGLTLSVCSPAFADDTTDVTEINTAAGVPNGEEPTRKGFHGVLGGGLFFGEKIVGNNARKVAVLPIVLLSYDDWAYWSFGGGGVWLLQSGDHSLKLGVGIKLRPGWRPEDDPELSGMAERRTGLDGSVNALWKTPIVTIGVNYYHDIVNVSNGDSATLRLLRNFWLGPRFRLTPSVGVEWLSNRLVNYYYGVRPEEALPTRPAYAGHDTLNFGAGLEGAYRLSRSWSLLGGFNVTHLGDGIGDSPIVGKRSTTRVFLGAGWRF